MKTLEQLKEMREKKLKKLSKSEFYEEYLNYNFVAYNVDYKNEINLYETYAEAKKYAQRGGQVLVLNTEKIYEYKVKTDDEFIKYIRNQIRKENYEKMNRYGL